MREDGKAEVRSAKTQNLEPKTHVALTIGPKRVIASALDRPGWARIGRDEQSALEMLCAYGSRYQRAVRPVIPDFQVPYRVEDLVVVERLAGSATTDYGVPDVPTSADAAEVDTAELHQLHAILGTCWDALDAAAASAEGKELRKGPRGGGRDLGKIVDHVTDAHSSYLKRIAWHEPREQIEDRTAAFAAIKEIDAEALAFAASSKMPAAGPRGGKLWTPRYFVRRAAWHILDHAWEIEDRIET